MSVTEQSGVSTLVGTPKEARASLSRSHADRVLVVSFDQVNLSIFEALVANFANVASMACSTQTYLCTQMNGA